MGGNLSYQSTREAQIAPGASVAGKVAREVPVRPSRPAAWAVFFWVRSLIATFALGLLVVLAFPGFTRRSLTALSATPWRSLGLGAAAVFGTPAAAAVLFALGVLLGGWWLAALLMGLYAIALAVCFPLVGAFIGRWLFTRLRQPGVHRVIALLVGLVVLTVLVRVPVVGVLVVLATLLFGLGAMILAGAQGRRAAA